MYFSLRPALSLTDFQRGPLAAQPLVLNTTFLFPVFKAVTAPADVRNVTEVHSGTPSAGSGYAVVNPAG